MHAVKTWCFHHMVTCLTKRTIDGRHGLVVCVALCIMKFHLCWQHSNVAFGQGGGGPRRQPAACSTAAVDASCCCAALAAAEPEVQMEKSSGHLCSSVMVRRHSGMP